MNSSSELPFNLPSNPDKRTFTLTNAFCGEKVGAKVGEMTVVVGFGTGLLCGARVIGAIVRRIVGATVGGGDSVGLIVTEVGLGDTDGTTDGRRLGVILGFADGATLSMTLGFGEG